VTSCDIIIVENAKQKNNSTKQNQISSQGHHDLQTNMTDNGRKKALEKQLYQIVLVICAFGMLLAITLQYRRLLSMMSILATLPVLTKVTKSPRTKMPSCSIQWSSKSLQVLTKSQRDEMPS
jgi:hypothetical protein